MGFPTYSVISICTLQGELTITADMEELGNALFLDDVPESWTRRAYPSMSGLAAWFVDLLLRIKELESWTSDFCLPNVVWLSGFFNPQSFLTAIEQSMARKNEWPLDKMALQVKLCTGLKYLKSLTEFFSTNHARIFYIFTCINVEFHTLHVVPLFGLTVMQSSM